MSELICLEHESNDGLRASVGGIRHGILVPVPVNLMQKAGTYYFVLHFKDSHADKYKDHQVKPALEMNQTTQQLPPIVYIHHGNWHIAWCLPGRGVIFRTVRVDPAEYCVVRDFTSATGQSQVRAAINGGFFNIIRKRGINDPKQDPFATDPKRKVRMIAEVGTGTKGKWEYSRTEEALPAVGKRARPERWCFGMSDKGQISISPMERRREKGIEVFRVHSSIEKQFPYGLSNVGLLVRNGKRVDPPPAWPRVNDETAPRTALAWTTGQETGGHIFFVTTSGATWYQVADFIRITLPEDILRKHPYNTRIDQSTINAVMLDGGGSTKFGYRLNPRKSSTYSGFPRNHSSDAPDSRRYLTTYITAEATFKE